MNVSPFLCVNILILVVVKVLTVCIILYYFQPVFTKPNLLLCNFIISRQWKYFPSPTYINLKKSIFFLCYHIIFITKNAYHIQQLGIYMYILHKYMPVFMFIIITTRIGDLVFNFLLRVLKTSHHLVHINVRFLPWYTSIW